MTVCFTFCRYFPSNMAETVEQQQQQQNVVVRLINLPFVSSTYDMVSSTYVTTKDNHHYLKSVCDIAEKSVKSITSVAITSAMPILQKLEPQIALANNIGCIGLDKIEERLPILYQPPEKVVAIASEAVVGARDAVIHSITGVVDKTKGAVQDSVEMTKAVVNGGINTVLGSCVVKIMSDRVDSALTRSECLLEQFLPPTDEELAKEATETEGFVSQDKPGYYVRLGSLSTKARKRVYQQALTRMKDAKCRSQEAIAQLQNTLDLIEYARKNMNGANQKIHDAQEKMFSKWVEWTKGTGEDAGGETEGAEQMESRTLTIARSLTHHLQSTCLSLVSSVQGLPQNIQSKAQSISAMAADIYQNFHSASSFREISDSLLTATKDMFTKIKDGMDDVMDYFINNTPLNWLVGPFYPKLASSQHGEQEDGGDSVKED
ncbi:perilipin-2-like isoform 1-T1 [Anomaloglossus baeobatrachus]|uniref:perilipin-2-like isoform X1 n=2 Tax=Anomaloglossus baeobatrachus TaxID=238106 RepID=UPI003F509946